MLSNNVTSRKPDSGSGAHFSKVPKTFRVRKAIRKTPTRLLYKAGFCHML